MVNKVDELLTQFDRTETTNPFKFYTDKLAGTLYSKNQAYGDSFTESVDKFGKTVIAVRLSDKFNRICNLINRGELKENASLQDLKDKEHDIKHLNLTYDRVVF